MCMFSVHEGAVVAIDTILPTRDWKLTSSRGQFASKSGRYFETISESTRGSVLAHVARALLCSTREPV